jgi:hypothetical protein
VLSSFGRSDIRPHHDSADGSVLSRGVAVGVDFSMVVSGSRFLDSGISLQISDVLDNVVMALINDFRQKYKGMACFLKPLDSIFNMHKTSSRSFDKRLERKINGYIH